MDNLKQTEVCEYKKKIIRHLNIGSYLKKDIMGFKTNFLNKKKKVLCNSFPIAISGSNGSGRKEVMIQLTREFIDNNEGFIYFCGESDITLYSKIFSLLKEKNKVKDLYFLNFLAKDKESTHTIDIINTTIKHDEIFKLITGEELFNIVQPICLSILEKNSLVTYENLQSFLSLEVIENFLIDKTFDKNKFIINEYLNKLKYFENKEEAIIKHSLNSIEFLNFLDNYETFKLNFSTSPSISIDKIISKNKVLNVNLKITDEPSDSSIKFYTLIYKLIEKEMTLKPYNLFVDDYYSKTYFKDIYNINKLYKSKLIIGDKYFKNLNGQSISDKFNTCILMQQEKTDNDFIIDIKLKTINELLRFPNVFYKDIYNQDPGEGFIFSYQKKHDLDSFLKSKNDYLLTSFKFNYKNIKISKEIYLNNEKL